MKREVEEFHDLMKNPTDMIKRVLGFQGFANIVVGKELRNKYGTTAKGKIPMPTSKADFINVVRGLTPLLEAVKGSEPRI